MGDLERELKIRLPSQSDYEKLCALLPRFEGEAEQLNVYWDLPGQPLTRKRILLRLRLEGEKAFLTVKRQPTRTAQGFFSVPECEQEVDPERGRAAIAGGIPLRSLGAPLLDDLESEFGSLAALEPWGTIRNVRRRYRIAPDLVAEVDRTEYPEERLYWEVEIEGPDAARAERILGEYLQSASIAHSPQTETKAERLRRLCPMPGESSD